MEWRPEPERKLRPFKPEEVPVEARIRCKHSSEIGYHCLRILFVGPTECVLSTAYGCGDFGMSVTFQELLDKYEYSLDKGLTWNPCGVMEGD